jgi:CRISPR-associated protein Cmr3
MKTAIFNANDTLFFREARPFESIGAKPLQGRFPPPARTLAGVLRTLAGNALDVDWQRYAKDDPSQQPVFDVIGRKDDPGLGRLALTGPFPMLGNERLYPAPLSLLRKTGGGFVRLRPGSEPVACDLGLVYLPELAEEAPGAKPLEDTWLTPKDLQRVLSGEDPLDPLPAARLFSPEARLGIALNHATHSVEDGMLYQSIQARPREDIAVGVGVEGLPEHITKQPAALRLGGEGRFASVRWAGACPPVEPTPHEGAHGVLLLLVTAARFEEGCWHPPEFVLGEDAANPVVWNGAVAGIELTLRAAVFGKSLREGGWDLAAGKSRPAQTLVPAGSVLFCTVQGDVDIPGAVKALQGKRIGLDQELGRGEIAAGYWL